MMMAVMGLEVVVIRWAVIVSRLMEVVRTSVSRLIARYDAARVRGGVGMTLLMPIHLSLCLDLRLWLWLGHHEVKSAVKRERGVLASGQCGQSGMVVWHNRRRVTVVQGTVPDSDVLRDCEALGEVGIVDGSWTDVPVIDVKPTIDQSLVWRSISTASWLHCFVLTTHRGGRVRSDAQTSWAAGQSTPGLARANEVDNADLVGKPLEGGHVLVCGAWSNVIAVVSNSVTPERT